MTRPRLLDLFCKAGGAGMGYHRAGFDVTGVDLEPQPRYPFAFIQGDALTFPLDGFDAIHASPPCQFHVKGLKAVNQSLGRGLNAVDLTARTRERLRAAGALYVIEGVVGTPLLAPVRLCGTAFGLPIYRHRMFESSTLLLAPDCEHDRQREKKYWTSFGSRGIDRRTGGRSVVVQVYGNGGGRDQWPAALGIDWMTPDELTQAIPPAYTQHIGAQLLAALNAERAA